MATKYFAEVNCDLEACKSTKTLAVTRDQAIDEPKLKPDGWIGVGKVFGGFRYVFCSSGCAEAGKRQEIDRATARLRESIHGEWSTKVE